jgi:hypothetical protein
MIRIQDKKQKDEEKKRKIILIIKVNRDGDD